MTGKGLALRAAAVVAMFGVGAFALWLWAFVEQRRVLGDTAFLVWGILVVALGLTSGLVFVYGSAMKSAIEKVTAIDWAPLRVRTLMAIVVVSALTSLNLVVDPAAATVRDVALTILAIVGGSPAATAMQGINAAVAGSQSSGMRSSHRLHTYLELRRLSSQLLSALGSLVALTTFALSASLFAGGGWGGLPTVQVLLVYGGFGATLVAVAYVVPRTGLRHEARALVADLAPLTAADAAELRQELDERDKLERHLGLQTDLLNELQTGIVILSPLLAAATALLIGGE